MTTNDLIAHRLHFQCLSNARMKTPGEVVRWLGAVQAQDYLGALWSVGQRLQKATEPQVEQAISEKTIVRTWPMRGTLHFVAAQDIRWMVKHFTPRVMSRFAGMLNKAGIDKDVLSRARKACIKALGGGKRLTRDELYQVLEKKKISTASSRGLHILATLAQEGLICFGPRNQKQQTFVLLDEWLPPYPVLEKEAALAEVATRYFTSHGPATLEDVMWWAGLTKKEATAAVAMAGDVLRQEKISGKTYWLSAEQPVLDVDPSTVLLLPTFDEYGISYKDRSAIISAATAKAIGGFYTAAVVMKGKVAGLWRRALDKDSVLIEVKALTGFSGAQTRSLEKACEKYAAYLRMDWSLKVGKK